MDFICPSHGFDPEWGSRVGGEQDHDVEVLWCNWLSLWTLNPTIRVQIPVEPEMKICRHGDVTGSEM